MRKTKEGMPERSGAPVIKVTTGAWWKSALEFLPKRMLTPNDDQGMSGEEGSAEDDGTPADPSS